MVIRRARKQVLESIRGKRKIFLPNKIPQLVLDSETEYTKLGDTAPANDLSRELQNVLNLYEWTQQELINQLEVETGLDISRGRLIGWLYAGAEPNPTDERNALYSAVKKLLTDKTDIPSKWVDYDTVSNKIKQWQKDYPDLTISQIAAIGGVNRSKIYSWVGKRARARRSEWDSFVDKMEDHLYEH